MKKNQYWIPFILVFLVIALSGCGKQIEETTGDGSSASPGKYVETEITPTGFTDFDNNRMAYPLGIFPRPGGVLDLLALNSTDDRTDIFCWYHSKDLGETWEMIDTSWCDALAAQHGSESVPIVAAALDDPGNLYCILQTDSGGFSMIKVVDGAVAEINIPDWNTTKDQNVYIAKFHILQNGDIAVLYDSHEQFLCIYDGVTGDKKLERNIKREPFAFISNGYAQIEFVGSEQAYKCFAYHCSGTEEASFPLTYNPQVQYAISGDTDRVFILSPEAVTEPGNSAAAGNVIMEASFYSFGNPSWSADEFKYCEEDKSFYLILHCNEDGSNKIYRYTYNASISPGAREQLSVFALQDSNTLRQAISSFQVAHPDKAIHLEIGLSEGFSVTKEDVIRSLNTELLAQKGPDVLILDGLPVESYIEKGALSDLSDLVADGGYFSNIVRCLSSDEKVYAIPARYKIPVMVGDKDLLADYNGLQKMADNPAVAPAASQAGIQDINGVPLNQRPLITIRQYEDLIKLFYSTYAPAFFNDKNTLNFEVLSKFLSDSKSVYQKYSLIQGNSNRTPEPEITSLLPLDVFSGYTLLGVADASGFMECTYWSKALNFGKKDESEYGEIYMEPLNGAATRVFVPTNIAAVNASSAQQETAKEFLKTLLSNDVQKSAFSEGFPVNKEAFQYACQFSKNESVYYALDMEEMAGSLAIPVIVDETILGAILDEVQPYYDDEETLDEAIAHIGAKLRTYLAEKS